MRRWVRIIAIIAGLQTALMFQPLAGQVVINEILCSNASGLLDKESGQFVDWIELHNMNQTEVDVSNYFLSDDPERPARWAIPAGTTIEAEGYLLIYPDKLDDDLHTNFGLSKDGEMLSLYDPNGVLTDYLEFSAQKTDVSYGRNPSNMIEWLWYGTPTPGADNGRMGVERPVKAPRPKVSLPGGFYQGVQEISLLPESIVGTRVFFTADGSVPDEQDFEFNDPIAVRKTTTLRFRAFADGLLPGDVVTQTYFIDEDTDLPVFSISTNPDYLWDQEIGIYVDGKGFNGSRESRNSCQNDWERPINIEFYDEDKQPVFNVLAGMEVKGRMNCEFPKKPLGIYFKSKYGDDLIDYQFFPEKPISQFQSFFLRPGGADGMGDCYQGTMFRDGFLSTILYDSMDIDYEGYRPAVLFLNGEYWGIHNIRERNKEDYLVANHDVDPDNLDILENPANGGIIAGDDLHYREMLYYVRSSEMATEAGLAGIQQRIDLQEFLNYQIAELFINNEDWGQNNVQCWREKKEGGLWRWVFFDVEGGFGLYGEDDYSNDLFDYKEDTFLKHAFLFEGILKNPVIRANFIQGFITHLNTTFRPERTIHIIDSLAGDIAAEMARDVVRWNGHSTTGGSGCSPISSMEQWQHHVQVMRDFAQRRPTVIIDQLVDHFGLGDRVNVRLENAGGSISVAGVEQAVSGRYFRNVPLQVKAHEDPGFQFVRWSDGTVEAERTIDLVSDTTLVAIFEHTNENLLPESIEESTLLLAQDGPFICTGDLIVEKNALLKVGPGCEIRLPAEAGIYVYGVLQMTGVEDNPVRIVCADEGERWGSISFDEAQPGSVLEYVDLIAPSVGSLDASLFKAALNIHDTELPVMGVRIQDGYKNGIYVLHGTADIRNCEIYVDGTGDYINIAECESTTIAGCEFIGNSSPDTDGIDLDDVDQALIQNNTFKKFSGFNSDGLDMGYSEAVVVEGNVFSQISDKAISVGMGSVAEVRGNLILNCNAGLGIKDLGSTVRADRNTFYGNNTAVDCFEKDPGRGGGMALVKNSLFAGRQQLAGAWDDYSTVSFSYSWDENDELPGLNNYHGTSGLLSPATGNFRLSSASGCRESGDPESATDPDGTRADIGAYYYHQKQYDRLFINELINTETDWVIELFNGSAGAAYLDDLILYCDGASSVIRKLETRTDYPEKLAGGAFATVKIPKSLLALLPGDLLVLAQEIKDETLVLSTLPLSSYLDTHSVGLYPDGSFDRRHFTEKTPGWANVAAASGQGQIFINEVMANNQNGIQDDQEEYEDWIELYNGGNQDVFLGGMFLTDDLDDPTKHQLPASFKSDLMIRPQGFALLWADGEPGAGVDHLNFRLNAEQEEIGLFRVLHPDTLLIDSLFFGQMQIDQSFGRYPDGSADLRDFVTPTPNQSNVFLRIDSFDTNLELSVYPNPCIDYLFVDIEGETQENPVLEVLNLSGQVLLRQELAAKTEKTITVPVNRLITGLYIARVRTGQQVHSARFYKK